MFTAKINRDIFANVTWNTQIIPILTRMGWNYDDPDDDMDILVNVPLEDEAIFDFIFEEFL